MSNLTIKQGQSYTFVGELVDSEDNPINISKFSQITALVTSPGIFRVVRKHDECKVEGNKLTFEISSVETRFFQRFVRVEVELKQENTVIIGTTKEKINVEHTNISKLWTN